MLTTPVLAENSEDALRQEMEVNVFGMLAMAKALAPALGHNGGGVIVNMLSVVSWYVYLLHVRRVKNGTPSTDPLIGDEMRALLRLQRESEPSPFVLSTPWRKRGYRGG